MLAKVIIEVLRLNVEHNWVALTTMSVQIGVEQVADIVSL
jgi:hypothetical protein